MLKQKLKNGEFVITAEIVPPLSASADDLMERVSPLAGLVDAINLTDGAGARLAMSSLAASAIIAREGIEPVLQMTCRDRNQIGLASDLLGASALGIQNVLILHGDDPSKGDLPNARPVFDLDSKALIRLAANLKKLPGPQGREISSPPDFHIGCADVPIDPPADWQPDGLIAKIEAGAKFAQTQFCFDVDVTRRYFEKLASLGITDQLKFIVGVGPLLSAKQAHFMNDNLFGVTVPEKIIARMEAAANQREEGQKICSELITSLKEIREISGVHIMAPKQNGKAIAQTIKAIQAS